MYDTSVRADLWKPQGDPSTIAAYLPQLRAARDALRSLTDDWAAKTAALDGDVVRRVLGTVGTTSPLFNIKKSLDAVMRICFDSAADDAAVQTISEGVEDVLQGITQVDFEAYSVNFAGSQTEKLKLASEARDHLSKLLERYETLLADIEKINQML